VIRMLLAASAVAIGSSCAGGGAGGSEEAFCDEAEEVAEVFRGRTTGEADPAFIGTLRDLSHEAPDVLRDDFEQATAAETEEELFEAVDEIEQYLREECGIPTTG
jgi:hypothetical protein